MSLTTCPSTPHSPLDRAVWWLEFLLRHPGYGERMRSPVHDLAWHQLLLLDVLLFAAAVLGLVVLALCKVVTYLCSCRGRRRRRRREEEEEEEEEE